MVRAAIVGLALALSSSISAASPWENDWPSQGIAWAFQTVSGSRYYIMADEITPPQSGQPETVVWMHGMHGKDKAIPYRRSIWRFSFNCAGMMRTLAYSQYNSAGASLDSWDGYSPGTAIRPGTMYVDIEKAVCKK